MDNPSLIIEASKQKYASSFIYHRLTSKSRRITRHRKGLQSCVNKLPMRMKYYFNLLTY
jgi:hypothetical protein